MIDQGIMTGNEHPELEAQALRLSEDVEKKTLIIENLLGGTEWLALRQKLSGERPMAAAISARSSAFASMRDSLRLSP